MEERGFYKEDKMIEGYFKGATTFSLMTQHNDALLILIKIVLTFSMINVILVSHFECRCAECHFLKFHFDEPITMNVILLSILMSAYSA
jgi:hypothetical protein